MTKEQAAEAYQKEIMDLNPNGFMVADYCNSETLATAFEAGWDAALAEFEAMYRRSLGQDSPTRTKGD